tara:strand:+ start:245 stop:469 length:225 start_codon:yes stop_codon:yes gene_type:complete
MPKDRQKGQAQFHPHKSLLLHVAAYILLMSAVTVATLSISSFFIAHSYVQQSTLVQLSSLVAAKEDLIEQRKIL